MTTLNKITKEEAKKVTTTPNSSFKNTEHNRKIVANTLREFIATLHNESPKYV
jgi:hypothetical protein